MTAESLPRVLESQRRPILAHCYRMLGSWSDAEDVSQEVLIRAWRGWERFEGRSTARSWLYTIATNACLSELRARRRRVLPQQAGRASPAGTPAGGRAAQTEWIEPFPDAALPSARGPEERAASRESVRLAFVAALQGVPPRQRAVLLLRDVIGFEAGEVAAMLGLNLPAVTSLLARARSRLERLRRSGQIATGRRLGPLEGRLLQRYLEAWEGGDVDALVGLLTDEARFSMPPVPTWFQGRESVASFLAGHVFVAGRRFRLLPTWANGQPAFGIYKAERGETVFRPHGVQVLTLEPRGIAATVTFLTPTLVRRFGLPGRPPARQKTGGRAIRIRAQRSLKNQTGRRPAGCGPRHDPGRRTT